MITTVENRDTSLAEAATVATLAIATLVPSLFFNLGVAHSATLDAAQLSLNVATVFLAPAAGFAAQRYAQERKIALAALAALLFATLLGYNLSTALGNVAVSRAATSESRAGVATKVSRLEKRRADTIRGLDRFRELSQGLSVELAAQEVTTHKRNKLYLRSQNCDNPTVQESIDLCTLYRGAEQRWMAAKEANRLRQDLEAIDLALNESGPKPADADPQVANLTALASLALPVDERWMAIILNARTAVVAELIGAFGPMVLHPIIAAMFGLFRTKRRGERQADPEPAPAERNEPRKRVVEPSVDPSVAAFVSSCVIKRKGGEVGGKALFAAYAEFCHKAGHDALGINKFGPEFVKLGFKKVRGRTVVYKGVAILPTNLVRFKGQNG